MNKRVCKITGIFLVFVSYIWLATYLCHKTQAQWMEFPALITGAVLFVFCYGLAIFWE